MPDQIYTDKDYLDAQFAALAVQFSAVHKRLDGHEKKHESEKRENRRTTLSVASLVLTAAGFIASFISSH